MYSLANLYLGRILLMFIMFTNERCLPYNHVVEANPTITLVLFIFWSTVFITFNFQTPVHLSIDFVLISDAAGILILPDPEHGTYILDGNPKIVAQVSNNQV